VVRADGLLVVNKPRGVTSRDVVDQAEKLFPGVRVGHAGTLDPLATGVLVLCLGKATRLIEFVQDLGKSYAVTVRLGAWSDTDDATGDVRPVADPPIPTAARVTEALQGFVGAITQVPPAFSAALIEGRRAYALARKGKEVALAPRTVRIDRITPGDYSWPHLAFTMDCGKGTYVRAVARDLGQKLGCGALVTVLTRTRIGPFHLAEAVDLAAGAEAARSRLLPLAAAVAGLPQVTLDEPLVGRLRHGQRVPWPGSPTGAPLAVLDRAGNLAAVARWEEPTGALKAVKVM
jgi:tRNA pseudouridine55 synthase